MEEFFFKKNTKDIKLYFKKAILLDNCYKMELKCNSYIVKNITKSVKKMKSQGNGRTLSVTHNATVPRYKKDVWFSKDTITNSISLKTWLNNIE